MSYYIESGASLIMNGPTGILVPLGIESVAGLSLAMVYMYYNYISLAIMFMIAAMAGSRSESRFIILLSILGGMLFAFGWIHAPDQTAFVAMLVIVGLLGVFSYMNDVNHEKHGVGGPGSKLLNIVFFLIIFQAAVGTINGFNLFNDGVGSQPTPNACTVGYQCDEFGNIKLSESIGNINASGGLLEGIASILSSLPTIAVTMLKFIVTLMASITMFSVVLNASLEGIFPGISANVAYVAFMALMQVAIWAIYALTIFTWYYKPTPGEGTL